MRFGRTGLIFKLLQRPEPVILFGIALAQSSIEAPVAGSSEDVAVCCFDYEISIWHTSLDIDCRPVARI